MKHRIFKYLLFSIFFVLGSNVFLFAQTSTDTNADTFAVVTAFIQKWGVFILALWEVVIRYIPTAQSLSFVTLFIRIIQFLVPDTKSVGNSLETFGAHDVGIKQMLNTPIVKGDKVRTKTNRVVEVQKFVSNDKFLATDKQVIPVSDVIEVVKSVYSVIDVVKNLITFFKALFSKKPTATN